MIAFSVGGEHESSPAYNSGLGGGEFWGDKLRNQSLASGSVEELTGGHKK